jgi:hypothetical protein
MGILGFLFNDPVGPFHNPQSPGNLSRQMNRQSTLLARRLVSMNAKRKNEPETLRSAVARLMLVVETQHRMMLQKGICTDAEFDSLLQSIDAEDGSVDGQRKP